MMHAAAPSFSLPQGPDPIDAFLDAYVATDAELQRSSRRFAWWLFGIGGGVVALGAAAIALGMALEVGELAIGGFLVGLLAGFPVIIGFFMLIASFLRGNDDLREVIRRVGYARVELAATKLMMHGAQVGTSWGVELYARDGKLLGGIKCNGEDDAIAVGDFLRARI
jgi:hypothetical protein